MRIVLCSTLCLILYLSLASAKFTSGNVTTCSSFNGNCSGCLTFGGCMYCPHDKTCYDAAALLNGTATNATLQTSCHYCTAADISSCTKACENCVSGFFPCSETVTGELILMIFYGILLSYGAKLISDGSELLLEILDPGIIGALLLPVLGALPDSAIVVVSGALSSDPQSQLNVGVGTLAGSTIMLLTIPWAVGLILARCDIRHGEAVDQTLTNTWSLTQTGATVDDDTPINARIMLLTSITYLLVQGVSFKYLPDPLGTGAHKMERWFALAGMIICFINLIAYCTYQVISPALQKKKIAEARRRYTAQLFLKKMMALHNQAESAVANPTEESRLLEDAPAEVPNVDIRNVTSKWKAKAAKKKEEETKLESKKGDIQEEEEENEKPSDWKVIALKSALLLVIGTAIVSVFSDPMVDVITDFGETIHVKSFYISFIITPICSNASELISSLIFAARKRKANTSLTYGQLYGAATMNNTMVLGIFFALVFFRKLAWAFTAETLSILGVTAGVGLIGAFTTTYRTWMAFVVFAMYPASLVFVWAVEGYAKWD